MFEPGDLLLFYGREWTSRVIEICTWGPSHVGIVGWFSGQLLLVESTTLCDLPCEIRGVSIAGVQAHKPEDRINHYDGRVERMRLAPAWKLGWGNVRELQTQLRRWIGRPYDASGAIWSGTRILKWAACAPYPDLGTLFCSELCAAVLMRLGRMPIGPASNYNPASLVRKLRRCGTYDRPEKI